MISSGGQWLQYARETERRSGQWASGMGGPVASGMGDGWMRQCEDLCMLARDAASIYFFPFRGGIE